MFTLPYEPRQIRHNIRTMCFTTALAGAFMFMAHPYLPLLLAYDVFLIGRSMQIMNQTTFQIILDSTKRHIYASRLNFLGYSSDGLGRFNLREVRYMGEMENTTITNDTFGLLPSIAQFMKAPEPSPDDKQGQFRYFYKFMCDGDVYLVSKDHPDFKNHIISEELLLDVIKGNQRKVLDYDFSEIDAKRE